ncbi:low temperature requirement protein A [bacterium]|nr:low temperature requirement protein A [bacterium]
MGEETKTLWSPPRLRTDDPDGHRNSTWTELFFDLIFVVCIAELTHSLLAHLDWMGLLGYFGLFIPVWWSWAGGTFYSDRFDADDVSHRLLTALQMLFVAAMATTIHGAWGEQAAAFAVCYALVRGIVIFNYLRVGWHHPRARDFAWRYAAGFSLAMLMWLASIWIPAPLRYWWLGLAMLLDLLTPFYARRFNHLFPLHRSHLPERFGLFTIIVLGESVLSIVTAFAQNHPSLLSAMVGAMGFAVIFAFWWVYFNSLEGSGLNQRFGNRIVWIYSHLPMLAALAAVSVGVRSAVLSASSTLADPQRWLLCGSVGLAYLLLGLQHLNAMGERCPDCLRRRAYVRIGSAAVLAALALFGSATAVPVLCFMVLLVAAFNVVFDLNAHALWQRELALYRQNNPGPDGQPLPDDSGLDLDTV